MLREHEPPPVKLDGLGEPIVDDVLYFIQDSRQVVGNCALWWRVDAGGYTCELREAGLYSGVEAKSMRTTDIAWPADAVRSIVVQHVRSEGLAKLREEKREGANPC